MPPDNANTQHIQVPGEHADRRESIWSVGEPWRWLYFTFFLLLMGVGSSLVGWDTLFGEGASEGMVQLLLAAFMAQAAVSVASAGMSLGITEVVMLSTMLARTSGRRASCGRGVPPVTRSGTLGWSACWRRRPPGRRSTSLRRRVGRAT